MSPPVRKIIHIDMDAFYASVEQRDREELRGKPVAVGSPNLRGVVAAASYEARKFGVRSAMPSTTALKKCPELIFVWPRFEVYRAVSRQIRSIFLEYTPLVEPLSLDEAYLDVTRNLRGVPTASETAKEIRARIFEWTGLTASAGISYNKFLAKLASDYKKPNGQFVVRPDMGAAFVEALRIEKFHGVGKVTAEKMNRLGIFTGADLKAKPLEFLVKHFGKIGPWYYAIARGEDDRPVEPDRPRKSSGSEITLLTDLREPAEIEKAMLEQAQEVWAWCEKAQMFGQSVTVKIKYADFHQVTRSRTLGHLVQSREELFEISLALTRSIFPVENGVRLVGVTVSHFPEEETAAPNQLDFDFG
ncbi:DNA polymerase-4 [Rhizomicrobium palustre]|uniref:DNA polymerase IV n=1 Tax=Rhizomicrobium palustre TaxID=189966 RepID=A0A846MVK5_9PROT|nr:DNA polymerase IV [Rhizomicrobium palustre]NIK87191.1 DNA polymerase-4 [Rhizomicrobium palustre]